MAATKILFRALGGPISAEVKVRTPQVAVYTLWLWERNSNTIVLKRRGNNQNPEDDVYVLPTPCVVNDGRLVECGVVIIDPTGRGSYAVDLTFTQGESVLHTLTAKGKVQPGSVTVAFMAKLEMAP